MHDISDRGYEKLAPEERFSLTMSALARNDLKQADLLWDTCPRFSYRAIDFEYANRVLATNIITLLFFQKVVYHYNVIKLAETHLLLIARNNPTRDQQKNALNKRYEHISKLKAFYQGIKQFCEKVGINYEDFLKTVPDHVCFDIDVYLSSDIEPKEEEIESAKNLLLEHWQF
jgi:hypothetical protein